jgi:spore photoproduct lyase
MRQLIEYAIDLRLWRQKPITELWDENSGAHLTAKPRFKAIMNNLSEKIDQLKQSPTDYTTLQEKPRLRSKVTHVEDLGDIQLLGRCPCPVSGEKTRCCNLHTLDVVQQCAFGCSYCSIQSFYHRDEIVFAANLAERLEHLELPDGIWHIGTGQSSDSLMWGNEHGILEALSQFATNHPHIVIELKTKSARTDWISSVKIPPNMVATWSLNAPTIIAHEEHKTASLDKRLAAARAASDAGIPVGFHLHPMIYFSGWENEYQAVIDKITTQFSVDEVVMISFGTLTFTKEALRELRLSGQPSRVLQMSLSEIAGKYSYPLSVKEQLFTHAYECFPASWKSEEGPFMYLCMEAPELWEPVFGRSYPDNATFEMAMKTAYLKKIGIRENS